MTRNRREAGTEAIQDGEGRRKQKIQAQSKADPKTKCRTKSGVENDAHTAHGYGWAVSTKAIVRMKPNTYRSCTVMNEIHPSL